MNNSIKMNHDMTYNRSSRSDMCTARSEALLMTVMVSFAPVALVAIMVLGTLI